MRHPAARLWLVVLLVVVSLLPSPTLTFAGRAQPPRAERWNPQPAPSGAEAAYPLNHTFDGEIATVGTPPTNHNFETPAYQVGTPPPNADVNTPAYDAGTPTNHTFATGDFTGWTTTGSPTINTDPTYGPYAYLPSTATITSSAFTVGNDAQRLIVNLWVPGTGSLHAVDVNILTGPTYGTSTQLERYICSSCNTFWTLRSYDATAYRGQSVKIKFVPWNGGTIGVDGPTARVILPNYTVSGSIGERVEANGNTYASLFTNGRLTTSAFTPVAEAQGATIRLAGLGGASAAYYLDVLSDPTYATVTTIASTDTVAAGWSTVRYKLDSWVGQSIKLRVRRHSGTLGVDDLALQMMEVPGWTVTGTSYQRSGGPSGSYVQTDGQITSGALALAADAQQLSLKYFAVTGYTASFYIELLYGTNFSQVATLDYLIADATEWKTFTIGVQQFAGQTVKLRVRRYFGNPVLIDEAGITQRLLPGWTVKPLVNPDWASPITVGEDSHGTYAAPLASGGDLFLESSLVQSGVLDRPGRQDFRYYSISYDIGSGGQTALTVYWVPTSGGATTTVVYTDNAATPVGYRTGFFYLYDGWGQTGYFRIKLLNGGKVYAIADNIAREQIAEPFAQKVGLAVDTATGAFAFEEQDLSVAGPLEPHVRHAAGAGAG